MPHEAELRYMSTLDVTHFSEFIAAPSRSHAVIPLLVSPNCRCDIRRRPPFLPLILSCDVSAFLLDDIFSCIGSLSLLNVGLAAHGDFATRGLNIMWINE
jgi:hypothetical protein